MGETSIKAVALFFFYAFLDEPLARMASANVISRFRQISKKKPLQGSEEAAIVYWTFKYWNKFQKRENSYNILSERGWTLPERFDVDAWKDFKRQAQRDEFLSVIWSKVLGYSDEQIAEGLKLTTGTVRHRIGRGLRALGGVIRDGGTSAEA